jgi:hypothetical protein
MKKFGDILPVTGVPAIDRSRLVGGIIFFFEKLLPRINNEQSRLVLGHKVVDCYKAMAILVLNAILFGAGLELAATSSFKIRRLISSPAPQLVKERNPRETVSYYASQDWSEQYWYEFKLSSKQQYYPYVGWRRTPFKGKTIKIDQNGLRLTPGADCSAKSFKVFVFGESSMWGTGSPDWGTIPANLQRDLAKMRQGPVCVMNFAESAYISTQDVIMLHLQLRSGNVPDLVLFYSIGGDIGAAYESGRVGVHANLDQIAARFEERSNRSTLVDWLRSTYAYSLIGELMGKLTIANLQEKQPGHAEFLDQVASTPSKPVTYQSMGIDVAKLSDSIVQDYLGNYEIVSALAQKYGFKYFFFAPPIISLGNKPLTGEEKKMKSRLESNAALDKLVTSVYQRIERESSTHQNLYSMVDIFDRYDGLLWIDEGHVTPVGNQLIAKRMLDIIQARWSDSK